MDSYGYMYITGSLNELRIVPFSFISIYTSRYIDITDVFFRRLKCVKNIQKGKEYRYTTNVPKPCQHNSKALTDAGLRRSTHEIDALKCSKLAKIYH
jgi:hypothetical protein